MKITAASLPLLPETWCSHLHGAQLEGTSDFCDVPQSEEHAILLVLPAQRSDYCISQVDLPIPGRTDPLDCPQAFSGSPVGLYLKVTMFRNDPRKKQGHETFRPRLSTFLCTHRLIHGREVASTVRHWVSMSLLHERNVGIQHTCAVQRCSCTSVNNMSCDLDFSSMLACMP